MRYPGAAWRPVGNFTIDSIRKPTLGLILHVQQGNGLAGILATFNDHASQASAHFWVGKSGQVVQLVDTDNRAWAQAAGNPDYLSVETEGYVAEPMTPGQLHALAALYSWGMGAFGWPRQLAAHPGDRGFGYHAMGGAAWGNHPCPGTLRIAQREDVLALIPTTPPTGGEDLDMDKDELKAAIREVLVEFMHTPALQSDEPGETLMSRDAALYRTYSDVRKTMGKIPDQP